VVNTLAVEPSGETVAVGGDVGVFVYDASTMEEIWAIPSEEPVISIAFSPDGMLLAAGLKDGTLALLDAADGFLHNALGGGGEIEVQSLAWSPDHVDPETGYFLVVGLNDGAMILSRVQFEGGGLDITFRGSFARNRTGITAIAFSPNNRILASGNRGGEIFLWDAETQEALVKLPGHEEYHAVQDLKWSSDGSQLLSGGRDGRVILWDMRTLSPLMEFEGHQGEVLAVFLGPETAQLASVDQVGDLIGWQAVNNQPLHIVSPAKSELVTAAWSTGGDLLAVVDAEARLITWDYKPPQLLPQEGRVLIGHDFPSRSASAAAWSPDGQILATANGPRIFFWDLIDPRPKNSLLGHQSQVTALTWSPDGTLLASGSRDQTIIIWDAEKGTHLRTLVGHTKAISDLAWSPGGEVLASTGALDLSVLLWASDTWQVAGELRHPSVGFWSLAWSPEGDQLVTGHGSGSLFFWDFSEGVPFEPYEELDGHLSWVADVAYSSDGTQVVSAGADTQVLLWSLTGPPARRTLAGHSDVVRGVSFHPDGGVVASGSVDHQVIFWDLEKVSVSGPRQSLRVGHSADVQALAWSPDGALLATGSQDGTVILWEADLDK
jgi:WD40 repeat protein